MDLESIREELPVFMENHPQNFHPGEYVEMDQLEQLAGGWFSDIYAFNAKFRFEGDEIVLPLILRIYPETDPHLAAFEFDTILKLEGLQFPVPHCYFLNDGSLPWNCVIMERLEGENLLYKIKTLTEESQEDQVGTLIQQFVSLRNKLRLIDWSEHFEKKYLPPFNIVEDHAYLEFHIDAFDAILDTYDFPTVLIDILGWLETRMTDFPAREFTLVHGDFHPRNIILTDQGLFVIDWADTQITETRVDVGWTLFICKMMLDEKGYEKLKGKFHQELGPLMEKISYFETLGGLKFIISLLLAETEEEPLYNMSEVNELLEDPMVLERGLALLRENTGLNLGDIKKILT